MDWKEDCINKAKALSIEKRQEFMDCITKEHLTLGGAYKKSGISFDEANGIMMMQIKETSYLETTI